MNDEQAPRVVPYESDSEQENKRRSRGERRKKWRKEMRRARSSEYDDGTDAPLPRGLSIYKRG